MIILLLGLLSYSAALGAPAEDFFSDLETVRSNSLVLRTEKERGAAELMNKTSRLMQFTPSISAGAGKTGARSYSDFTGSSRSSDDYWRVSADWNLFRGLGDYQSWMAARGFVEAQNFQAQSEELRVELEGAKAIFRNIYLREAHAAQAELLLLKQEAIRIGRSRYAQGKISLQEVEKMELDLSEQQNALRLAQIDLAENELNYRALFLDSLKTQIWPLKETQALALGEGLGSFSVKRLQAKASALEHSWRSAFARHLPSLDFSLSYRQQPFWGPNVQYWSGTIELSLPLWSRMEIANNSAQAYVGFVEAENLALTAEREEALKREYLNKKADLSRANVREANLNQEKSNRVYRDMFRSFQLGRLSTNDLFQEQARRIKTVLSLAQSQWSYHETLAEACTLWGLSLRACLR